MVSNLEEEFAKQLGAAMKAGLIHSVTPQYRPLKERLWRIDFALIPTKIAIEVDGGIFIRGRHARGNGIEGDSHKQNTMTMLGWRCLRVTPSMIKDGTGLEYVIETYKMAKANPNSTSQAVLINKVKELSKAKSAKRRARRKVYDDRRNS